MANYHLRDKALADLDILYEYGIVTFGLQMADGYYDGLIEQFESLATNPKMYRERWELNPPVRICPYKSHTIIYMIEKEEVVIIRVRHSREDWQ